MRQMPIRLAIFPPRSCPPRASDKYRYPQAIKTIGRLRDSYHRAGDEAGFTAYVADLRQRHRRKTSFITKLDKALVRH